MSTLERQQHDTVAQRFNEVIAVSSQLTNDVKGALTLAGVTLKGDLTFRGDKHSIHLAIPSLRHCWLLYARMQAESDPAASIRMVGQIKRLWPVTLTVPDLMDVTLSGGNLVCTLREPAAPMGIHLNLPTATGDKRHPVTTTSPVSW